MGKQARSGREQPRAPRVRPACHSSPSLRTRVHPRLVADKRCQCFDTEIYERKPGRTTVGERPEGFVPRDAPTKTRDTSGAHTRASTPMCTPRAAGPCLTPYAPSKGAPQASVAPGLRFRCLICLPYMCRRHRSLLVSASVAHARASRARCWWAALRGATCLRTGKTGGRRDVCSLEAEQDSRTSVTPPLPGCSCRRLTRDKPWCEGQAARL